MCEMILRTFAGVAESNKNLSKKGMCSPSIVLRHDNAIVTTFKWKRMSISILVQSGSKCIRLTSTEDYIILHQVLPIHDAKPHVIIVSRIAKILVFLSLWFPAAKDEYPLYYIFPLKKKIRSNRSHTLFQRLEIIIRWKYFAQERKYNHQLSALKVLESNTHKTNGLIKSNFVTLCKIFSTIKQKRKQRLS